MKIIDSHVHVEGRRPFTKTSDYLSFHMFGHAVRMRKILQVYERMFTRRGFLNVDKYLSKNKLDNCILMPLSKEGNLYCSDIKNVYKFFYADPGSLAVSGKMELENFNGVKIHPVIDKIKLNSERYSRTFSYLEKKRFPITIHTGFSLHKGYKKWGHPSHLAKIMSRHKKLNVIVAHVGSIYWKEISELIMRHKHLYVDTSSCGKQAIRGIYRKHGAGRMIFGSDFPMGNPVTRAKLLKSVIKDKEDQELVFHRNAEEILKT